MEFYKLINGQSIVGVATSLDLRKFQSKHNIMLSCGVNEAQYIQCLDVLYHTDWMLPAPNGIACIVCTVTEIDCDEYDTLKHALDSGEPVEEPQERYDDPQPQEEYRDPIEEITVDFVRSAKVNEMSISCGKMIENGFDLQLLDGENCHFSLTTQDQLNFITLSVMIASGKDKIPYHADGKLCRYFSAADMQRILDKATEHKAFHTTYFNSLKKYINSLDDIETIKSIEYGVEVPESYMSEVLKDMYAVGTEGDE